MLAYLTGHAVFADYLNLLFLPRSGELTVYCAAVVGAGIGFLWFNAHPARIFMGDTGSLALGGALGTVAILVKKELLLVIIGGMFVVEAVSVMLQVTWFKRTRRQAALPHGAAAPPLRAERLVRDPGRGALLDRRHPAAAAGHDLPQAAVGGDGVGWDVKGHNVWVIGLARSGCAAGLLLRDDGARVIGVDDADDAAVRRRWDREGLPTLAPRAFDEIHTGGGWPIAALPAPWAVVISPGVPPDHPLLRGLPAGVPVLGELELASRWCAAPIVAVTGTNGKSTTTEWIAHLARTAGRRAEALGNVGRPLSLVAEELGPADLAVVEVSSFQLETVSSFAPQVGVVLNLAPDHLDRYPDLAAYYAAKQVLAGCVPADGSFVTWTGCPEARAWPTAARRVLFGDAGQGASVRWEGERLVAELEGEARQSWSPSTSWPCSSPPNLLNALASVAAAAAAGTPTGGAGRGAARLPGPAPSPPAGGPPRGRGLRQRLQGHQRARGVRRAGRLAGPGGADRRRQRQGRGLRAPARGDGGGAPPGGRSARRVRPSPRPWPTWCPRARPRAWTRPWPWPRTWPNPTRRCC